MDAPLNWPAVLLAPASTFLIGGLWYSLLFARPWRREVGLSEEQLKAGSARIFVSSFLLALVMATSLAAFIGDGGFGFGVFAGAAAGLGFVAAAVGVNYLFERRSLRLFVINASFSVVSFTVMGSIIGALQ